MEPRRVTDGFIRVRDAVAACALDVLMAPPRPPPVPCGARLGVQRFAAAAGVAPELMCDLIAAGAVTTVPNKLARPPVDVTSAPDALAGQLVALSDIGSAVRAADVGAVEAALVSIGVRVLPVGGAPCVLHSALVAAGGRVPVSMEGAERLLGMTEGDVAYLAHEGALGELHACAGGAGAVTLDRDAVSGERVRARLTPLADLMGALMPLAAAAGASVEDLRSTVDGALAERGARVLSVRGVEFVLAAEAEAAAGVIRGRQSEA
jgi:hypothetical protein